MKKIKQNYLILDPRYWTQRRSIKNHAKWLALIKNAIEQKTPNFGEKVDNIIKNYKQRKKSVYILCKPTADDFDKEIGNRGFRLYYDPKRNPDLMIESAGNGGLSSFSYSALTALSRYNISTTNKTVNMVLKSEKCLISIEDTV